MASESELIETFENILTEDGKETEGEMNTEVQEENGQNFDTIMDEDEDKSDTEEVEGEGEENEDEIENEIEETVEEMEEDVGEGDIEVVDLESGQNLDAESETILVNDDDNDDEGTGNDRSVRLPLSRIKKIMKTDDQVGLVNKDALIATTILTEHFISLVAHQSYKLAAASKKKTVNLNHVKSALTSSSMFDFLEGTLPQLES